MEAERVQAAGVYATISLAGRLQLSSRWQSYDTLDVQSTRGRACSLIHGGCNAVCDLPVRMMYSASKKSNGFGPGLPMFVSIASTGAMLMAKIERVPLPRSPVQLERHPLRLARCVPLRSRFQKLSKAVLEDYKHNTKNIIEL